MAATVTAKLSLPLSIQGWLGLRRGYLAAMAILDAAVGTVLSGSATFNPASSADGAGATTTVTVTGADLGDFVTGVSFTLDLAGISVTAWVSAADTVSVRFQNESGGTLDLASGTLRALVRKA